MQRSDRELVQEARSGDKEAFRELVERYERKIISVAQGMLQNRDDALEIAQETFVKAFENLGNFKGESSFYTWLYRIVVNRAIDFQRRERRHPTVELDSQGGAVESYDEILKEERRSDPYHQAKAHEIGDRVNEAIGELTPDHRAVILLREVEGLSYDEISRVMQCSKGTVMSRLHYARKKLQQKLKDCI